MFRKHPVTLIAVSLLLVSAGCGGLPATNDTTTEGTDGQSAQSGEQTTVTESGGNVETTETNASPSTTQGYTELYDRTIDSVVEITVGTQAGQSQGSGFIYSNEGYIVTNQHVVGDADTVQVRFSTGEWRTGEVVGTDVYTDLAVIRVESLPDGAEPLPLAETNPEPGQPVVALGSPLGLEGTITSGIVSGVNRSMRVAQGFSIPDTVQTDAPINPGNSGGPLVTLDGTVVGVNRAKQGDNLGFAISADVVQRVVPAIIEDGSYEHSHMGVSTLAVTPPIAEATGLSEARGVIVVDVVEGGPAAGVLQPAEITATDADQHTRIDGDVIVSIDDRPIQTQQALARYLLLHTQPGDEVTVTVMRDGERVTETLTLGQRPEVDTSGPV